MDAVHAADLCPIYVHMEGATWAMPKPGWSLGRTNVDPARRRRLDNPGQRVRYHRRFVEQRGRATTIRNDTVMVPEGVYEDRTECGIHYCIPLVSHAGRVPLVIAVRRSDDCEREGMLLDEECGLKYLRSTADMMFVVRRHLKEPEKKDDIPQLMCVIDITKYFNSVARPMV